MRLNRLNEIYTMYCVPSRKPFSPRKDENEKEYYFFFFSNGNTVVSPTKSKIIATIPLSVWTSDGCFKRVLISCGENIFFLSFHPLLAIYLYGNSLADIGLFVTHLSTFSSHGRQAEWFFLLFLYFFLDVIVFDFRRNEANKNA